MKRQTSTVCFFVLAADEDAEPTSRGCYSTKRYLKLNFKNTTSTQATEASRIGFTKLAEPYLGYPLNISYSNQNSLGGDDNIPSFKSDGANGLRSTRIWNLRTPHLTFLKCSFSGLLHFKNALYVSLKNTVFPPYRFLVPKIALFFCLHLTTIPFIRHVFFGRQLYLLSSKAMLQ